MALKDWSIGKIVGVMAGGFIAVLIVTVLVASSIKKHRATSTTVNVAPVATMASRPRSDGLLDDQLRQLSNQMDTLQQHMDSQAQQGQKNNLAIMQNFNTIQGQVKALADRVAALEHPTAGPVQVVKPTEKPRVSQANRLARVAKRVPRRSGYQTEAVVGQRAWLRVNGVEATRAVGEDLPQAEESARIKAVSADSGIFVVPTHSN